MKTVYPPTNIVCGGYENVYPCKPQFYYIKVGCKGVYIVSMMFLDNLNAKIQTRMSMMLLKIQAHYKITFCRI